MNLEREQESQEAETPIVDIEAAVADIGSELFATDGDEKQSEGQGDSEEGEASVGDVESPAEIKEPEGGESASIEGAEGDNSQEVQETGAPKTWTKESLEEWTKIPPRAQQEILKREEDFLNGISQYKSAAEVGQKYDAVVEPYRAILAAENVDPVQLFQAFSANHYLLSRGTTEQKIQLAAHMFEHYKIPLAGLLEFMGDRADAGPVDPEIAALRKEIGELKSGFTARQSSERDAAIAAVAKQVDEFAADPKNIYFQELAQDIQQLFDKGMASTMQEAYDKALWSNPSTRQKENARLAAEASATAAEAEQARLKEKAKAKGDQVRVKPHQRDGTVVTAGSIDDTLQETLAAIKSRGSSE